jgi:hypothetical protein
MKFLLFKLLLQRRARDEGFTLPMVVALGLIMILLSAVNVVQSNEENLTAISVNDSADALAMAEIGVARYRELLNNNRVLAVHNHTAWSNFDETVTNPATDPTQVCDSNVGTFSDTTNWKTINDGSGNIGEYQLVSYEYDNDGILGDNNDNGVFDQTSDTANNNARGILTVKGRTTDGSITQLQTEIPIGINTKDLDTLSPTLWIQKGSATSLGTVVFGNSSSNADGDGNLVLYHPTGLTSWCADPAESTIGTETINVISDPRILPDVTISTVGTSTTLVTPKVINGDIEGNNSTATGEPSFNKYVDQPNALVLGTKTDDDDAFNATNNIYYYRINGDLEITNDQNLISDGEAKVVIFVYGNVEIDGNVNIQNSSGDATSRFLEIHTTGNVTIQNTSGAASEVNIKGLIYAPNGTVTISGSTEVNIIGSVWADDWNNTSTNTVTITPDDYKYYSITTKRTPQPLTYRPTEWEVQEAQ